MKGGRVGRNFTWETDRLLQGLEKCVLQGQTGMSRTFLGSALHSGQEPSFLLLTL